MPFIDNQKGYEVAKYVLLYVLQWMSHMKNLKCGTLNYGVSKVDRHINNFAVSEIISAATVAVAAAVVVSPLVCKIESQTATVMSNVLSRSTIVIFSSFLVPSVTCNM